MTILNGNSSTNPAAVPQVASSPAVMSRKTTDPVVYFNLEPSSSPLDCPAMPKSISLAVFLHCNEPLQLFALHPLFVIHLLIQIL
jgi:hypothetical protein